MEFAVARGQTIYDPTDQHERNWMIYYALPIQIMTTLLFAVRILNRFTGRGQFGIDDVFIVLAWILGTALTVLVLLATYRFGFNRHVWNVPPEVWGNAGLIGWCIQGVFFWSTCFTKISVLMFYRRLVSGTFSRKFKWAIWAAIAFVVAYTISFFVVTCTTCSPIVATWRQFDPKWVIDHKFKCASRDTQVRVAELVGSLSVVTDFYSVMLPAVLIMRIRVNKSQKYGLFFIFGLGFLVVGAGIARTIFLKRIEAEIIDRLWVSFNVFLTSIAECNIAIICACAPSLKSLFGRCFKGLNTKYSSRSKGSKGSKGSSNHSSNNQASSKLSGTLSLSRNKGKAAMASANNGTDNGWQEQSSFRKAHEYGLEASSPVTQGYGEDLVSPRSGGDGAETTMDERALDRRFIVRRFAPIEQNIPRDGSFILSPTPSVSSDDEVSLVLKKHDHDGIPYGLPSREDDTSLGPSLSRPAQTPTGTKDGITSPAPPRDRMSPFSDTSFISASGQPMEITPHAVTTDAAIEDPTIPRRTRRSFRKERWRQIYETPKRYPTP